MSENYLLMQNHGLKMSLIDSTSNFAPEELIIPMPLSYCTLIEDDTFQKTTVSKSEYLSDDDEILFLESVNMSKKASSVKNGWCSSNTQLFNKDVFHSKEDIHASSQCEEPDVQSISSLNISNIKVEPPIKYIFDNEEEVFISDCSIPSPTVTEAKLNLQNPSSEDSSLRNCKIEFKNGRCLSDILPSVNTNNPLFSLALNSEKKTISPGSGTERKIAEIKNACEILSPGVINSSALKVKNTLKVKMVPINEISSSTKVPSVNTTDVQPEEQLQNGGVVIKTEYNSDNEVRLFEKEIISPIATKSDLEEQDIEYSILENIIPKILENCITNSGMQGYPVTSEAVPLPLSENISQRNEELIITTESSNDDDVTIVGGKRVLQISIEINLTESNVQSPKVGKLLNSSFNDKITRRSDGKLNTNSIIIKPSSSAVSEVDQSAVENVLTNMTGNSDRNIVVKKQLLFKANSNAQFPLQKNLTRNSTCKVEKIGTVSNSFTNHCLRAECNMQSSFTGKISNMIDGNRCTKNISLNPTTATFGTHLSKKHTTNSNFLKPCLPVASNTESIEVHLPETKNAFTKSTDSCHENVIIVRKRPVETNLIISDVRSTCPKKLVHRTENKCIVNNNLLSQNVQTSVLEKNLNQATDIQHSFPEKDIPLYSKDCSLIPEALVECTLPQKMCNTVRPFLLNQLPMENLNDLMERSSKDSRSTITKNPRLFIDELIGRNKRILKCSNFQKPSNEMVETFRNNPPDTGSTPSAEKCNNLSKAKSNYYSEMSCKFCHKLFPYKSALEQHLSVHTGDKKFCCTICPKKFSYKNKLVFHMRSHTNETKPHSCQICGKGFNDKYDLKQHTLIHTGTKPHHCPLCEGRFTQKSQLKTHLRKHTGEKPFSCELCDEKFRAKDTLNSHMKLHLNRISCHICNSKFAFHHDLMTHLTAHTKKIVVKEINCKQVCSLCNSSFDTRNEFLYHFINLHINKNSKSVGDSHSCPICKITLSSQTILLGHIQRHIDGKGYQCHICQKRFLRPSDLKFHEKIHTGEKPFCKFCGKKFLRKYLATIHECLHTGEKPFSSD